MGNASSIAEQNELNKKSKLRNNSTLIELLVIGYLRILQENINQNNAYQNVYNIIQSFYHKCYAKYILIDGIKNDKNGIESVIKNKTSFGDIIEIKYENKNNKTNKYGQTPFFAVIYGSGDDLCPIPCFIMDESLQYVTIEIPFQICRKLENVIEYYSKLMKNGNLRKYGLTKWNFITKHNDKYLVNKFGGCFKYGYEPIKLSFDCNKLTSFTVALDTALETIFFHDRYEYSHQDIHQFYEIRHSKRKKLMKIEIQQQTNEFNQHKMISFPSGKWEYNFKCNQNLNIINEYFIGPLNEKQAMFDIINTLYSTIIIKHMNNNMKSRTLDGFGSHVIVLTNESDDIYIDNIDMELHRMSKWDIELENEYDCLTITPSKLKQIITKCPSTTHLYGWKLFYSTEMHGLSIHTMYKNIENMPADCILIIKENTNHIFGAYIDCKWIKPLLQKQKGDIKYRGSVDCFVFNYVNKTELKIYKACNESPYYFRNDETCVTIGAGEAPAIYFEYDFNYGRSVACNTYNSPQLSNNTQFKINKIELWAPNNQ